MNTWIAAHASAFSSTNAITLSPINTTNTSLNLPMTSAMGPFFPGQSLFVSSVQMHIKITNPRIEFLAGTTSVHVIQNTGRYTGTSLQTFDVPHVNMSQVTTVSISSTSTIDPNIIWYGLQRTNNADQSSGFIFTGNFTFDTVPLMIFDNATELTAIYELTTGILANPPITSRQTTINQININPVGYNFNPFYLTIPTFRFTGSGASTATPVPFSLRLSETNFFNFTLNTGTLYPNGIVIPFTNPSVVPPSENGTVVTLTNTITPPQFIRGSASITGSLICLLTGVLNLNVVTLYNENSGLAVRLFGTGVTIDPVFDPTTMSLITPITFAPNRQMGIPTILTETSRIASNPMSYTIIQPTPAIVTLTNQTYTLPQQFNANNATITVVAHSRGVPGLNPRSIFSQPSIFNYHNLLPGRVVPFVNTFNDAPMTYLDNSNPSSFASMNVTFTQNVVLNSLDFGYVFPIFLPASTVTTGGYAVNATSSVTAATFTITVTSVPRTVGEPVIAYGRVQFVCRQNHGNAYMALHSAVYNPIGANDGTLISIPFTTTALTPLPTFVNSFTPSVAGSNFAFNVGDQVRIEFGFGQAGSQYFGTPTEHTQYLGILQEPRPEMLGALVCTPNTVGNPTFNPLPAIIGNSSGNSPITALIHTVETQLISFNAPTIICGFRLTSFRLTGITAIMRIRVNLFRNGNPTSILQVYFNYSDSRLSGTPAPLFIPFSYAEFARYAAIPANANDVVRIDPMTIVFSRPQHPIFNAGDTLRIEISVTTATTSGVQSQTSPQSIAYTGNANDNPNTIGGRLTGIILNTPTITFPSPGVTPVFVVLGARDIPIPTPTSNSPGAVDYTVTSQSVNPTTAPAPSIAIINNNVRAQNISNIHSRIFINAWQRSSTNFTNGSVTSTIDYVNTSQTFAAYSTFVPNPNSPFEVSARPFVAWIVQNSTRLEGFSFQFFGGYGVSSPNQTYTMRVWITRDGVRQTQELTIAFTTSTSVINPVDGIRNPLDGTFAYIPFQQNIIQTPTHVSNLMYTGSLPDAVLLGDIVRVSLNGNGAGMQRTRLLPTTGGDRVGPLMGSLLHSPLVIGPSISATNGVVGPIDINASNMAVIFNANITNAIPLVLMHIRMPFIQVVGPTAPVLPPPTVTSPHRMRVVIMVADGATSIYTCEIVICITAGATTGFIDIPFNMPRPTEIRSADGDLTNNYFIESFNPRFDPVYFNIDDSTPATSAATYSFPRIRRLLPLTTNFCTYVITVANLDNRQIQIRDSLVGAGVNSLGLGIMCQLGWINFPNQNFNNPE